MVSSVSRSFGIIFFKNIVFLPCFFSFLQLNFHFYSLLNQFLCLENPHQLQKYCFFSPLLQVQIYGLIYFMLVFRIQITSSFQLFYLIYFSPQCFFRYLSFILFIVFLSCFLEVETYNLFYLILIFSIQITRNFQLFYLIYLFANIFLGTQFVFFCCFFLFFFYFLEVQIYNLIYFTLILCIQITSSFQLFYFMFFFVQYLFRNSFLILFIAFLSYFLEVQTYALFYLI